jgi:hypothetical protein
MATPPTFSAGSVLTAAQMNQLGLFLIKTETIGATVTAVEIEDVFTSDFENYRVVVTGGTQTSANSILIMQLMSGGSPSVANYYATFPFTAYAGSSFTILNTNNGASWPYVAMSLNNGLSGAFDVYQPATSNKTSFGGFTNRGDISGFTSGYHNVSSAYDGFKLSINAGTMTGGIVRIYGYRN